MHLIAYGAERDLARRRRRRSAWCRRFVGAGSLQNNNPGYRRR